MYEQHYRCAASYHAITPSRRVEHAATSSLQMVHISHKVGDTSSSASSGVRPAAANTCKHRCDAKPDMYLLMGDSHVTVRFGQPSISNPNLCLTKSPPNSLNTTSMSVIMWIELWEKVIITSVYHPGCNHPQKITWDENALNGSTTITSTSNTCTTNNQEGTYSTNNLHQVGIAPEWNLTHMHSLEHMYRTVWYAFWWFHLEYTNKFSGILGL